LAFWAWSAAAVLLLADGLWLVWSATLLFFRGGGAIFVIAGLAVAYMASRTRQGDKRFQRALVALSTALVPLLLLFIFAGGPLLGAFVAALLITAMVLATRQTASEWFDAVDSGGDGG
jgi:hypothetical protein